MLDILRLEHCSSNDLMSVLGIRRHRSLECTHVRACMWAVCSIRHMLSRRLQSQSLI
jgi:hypothetical protein